MAQTPDTFAPLAAQASTPTDELIRCAVGLARTCLGMEVGFVTEFRNGVRIFRHVESVEGYVPVKAGDYDPLDQSYCQRIVDGSIPALVEDTHAYPELLAMPITAALGIRAHAGVPICFSDGAVFGTFCCYSRDPAVSLGAFDAATLRKFAALIGELLEARVKGERAHAQVVERLMMVIAGSRLKVVYQPVRDVASDTVVGYEALARFMTEPVRTPDVWFDEAHTVALGHRLEVLAIEKALQGLAQIPADAYLALNVSPQTILSGALEAVLQGAPLGRLMLEVTEHESIADYTIISASLGRMRTDGLRLAVDDAGSGYASFRHILKLKPDVIKLDQSLIRDIDHEPGARALAAAIITFAAATGSTVVAEGIETPDEMEALRELGVTRMQGYLLGRPAPLPGGEQATR
ncbi:EAL domain-containing protein [Massilia sp. PAMC28688]|uniref:sensor domain-containing phosphodiesterase n=1 Tax=Massilia sp. PAMC28688 TaxID=2861283 RepID=UPI001C628D8C|nr:EAL domain-containing protein [Massilia sp. PAMC28688]QYF92455.1 EAL domain-containing protein [Massilia sp. PAMC28688]